MNRVVLFPGQGAQSVGMAADFHRSSAAAREMFRRAEEALGIPLARLCFEGPERELESTDICQPAILTCSAAILMALEERGVLHREAVTAVAGLSLGEYTALWYAGAIAFEEVVRLVRVRGSGMQEASNRTPSGMSSLIGATEESAQELCRRASQEEVLVLANLLSPGNLVISGSLSALERAAQLAKECGIRRVIPLKVAGAFHSPLMQPAVLPLEEALASIELTAPAMPVISNVTAQAHGSLDELRRDLLKQVTSPVRWEASMRNLLQIAGLGTAGVRDGSSPGTVRFLEPGPGTVLSGLLRKIDRDAMCESAATWTDLESLLASASTSIGDGRNEDGSGSAKLEAGR